MQSKRGFTEPSRTCTLDRHSWRRSSWIARPRSSAAERLTAAGARIAGLEADLDATTTSNPTWPLVGLSASLLALAGFVLGRRYATRTLVTGASRSWAENQDAPASAEPNTSPLVAPK